MTKIILTLICAICTFTTFNSQNINLDEYEIYIGDTLVAKSDFVKFSNTLTEERSKKLQFKPISDGAKKAYFFNGKLSSNGTIKNLKENGFWQYWHPNGKKAREGEFVDGKPNGTHKYWYENGDLRAIGNWKNGVYDGKWEMYQPNKEIVIQVYKDGKLIE
ncbi:hypothetical protein NAL32_13205 [Chryseobacterium sp. Ch-15]|uniref:MORN repeat variant n=1 Tax=Chryseobacterium muglaense TaxID=2893752 RepID=A0A9Q3UZY7_9FLAO|nr:hypothetical protein [Chryseobacterium muglaense]MBD3906857.1 hypothetical protein [Chryseobacterium muglaense]MCC9036705.1 hypothetical protein [Chryseobacterium muglaense]MCM2555342.1 hypothetical protein [Chryseobacterium muglaense]